MSEMTPPAVPTMAPPAPPAPPAAQQPSAPTPAPPASSAEPVEDTGETIDTVERASVDIDAAKQNGVVESNVWPGVDIETGERTDGSAEPNTEESK